LQPVPSIDQYRGRTDVVPNPLPLTSAASV
jgi:hypothetical protein